MDTREFAGYTLVSIGALVALAGIGVVAMHVLSGGKKPGPFPIKPGGLFFATSLVFMGVGGWGPSFLKDASGFFKEIATISAGGADADAAADKMMNDIAEGKVDEKYLPVARMALLQNPPADAGAKLDRAAQRARKPQHKEFFLETRRRFDAKLSASLSAVPAGAGEAELSAIDPDTLRVIRAAPTDRLTTLRLDRAAIERLARPRIP